MGRLTLFLVTAAILGGSAITYTMRGTLGETGRLRGEGQSGLLARQLAESGQGIALTQVTTRDGFEAPPSLFVSERPYNSGVILFADYDETPVGDGGERAEIVTSGTYGGALHTLRSTYEFDPMDFPGPIWLDVPYASATVDKNAAVSGGRAGYESQIDPRKYNDLGVREFGLTFKNVTDGLKAAGSSVPSWSGSGGRRLSNLGGVQNADDLYYTVTNAVDVAAGDRVITGNQTVNGTLRVPSNPDGINVVKGDLTIRGTVEGDGALVVEGDLRVPGRLVWDGLVLVRSTENQAVVDLSGDVSIDGALVVSQEAYPPGGHVDLTTFRDPLAQWVEPFGRRQPGPEALNRSSWNLGQKFTWYDHTHRFDEPERTDADAAARAEKLVRFVDRAAGDPQEDYTGLRELLNYLGSTPVQVEFDNVSEHGHSVYAIEVAGLGPVTGPIARGFTDTAVGSSRSHRTLSFPARDLRQLTVQPRSLRSLRELWDGRGSCYGDQWPFCVGEDRSNRAGALTVRIRRASDGRALYEGAVYWHMQEGQEAKEYNDYLKAFKDGVQSGAIPFGTHLTLGPRARITYELGPIVDLAEKLGFDGNEVRRLGTTSAHVTPQEMRAAALGPVEDPATRLTICHDPGSSKESQLSILQADLVLHLLHGDTLGACGSGGSGGS